MPQFKAWLHTVNFGQQFGVRTNFPLVQFIADGPLWTTAGAVKDIFQIAGQSLRDFLRQYKEDGVTVETDMEVLRELKRAGVLGAGATKVQLLQLGRACAVAQHFGLHEDVADALFALRREKPKPPARHVPGAGMQATTNQQGTKRPANGEAGWYHPEQQRRLVENHGSASGAAAVTGVSGGSERAPPPRWPPPRWVFPMRLTTIHLTSAQRKVRGCGVAPCMFTVHAAACTEARFFPHQHIARPQCKLMNGMGWDTVDDI